MTFEWLHRSRASTVTPLGGSSALHQCAGFLVTNEETSAMRSTKLSFASIRSGLGCMVGVAALVACASLPSGEDAALLQRAQQLFKPLPADASTPERPITPERVALGKALFFEPRLSVDNRVSCATCHQPSFYGAEPLAVSVGIHSKVLPRNTPTIFNTALQFVQHYGGNRVDVEDQATKALLSPLAYGQKDVPTAEARLRELAGYRAMFEKAFPGEAEPMTLVNLGKAVGAYERVLLTPAPFDRFLAGDTGALSVSAKRGLDTFVKVGCAGCHNGVALGGQTYQKFGITADYWTLTGSKPNDIHKSIDKGRFQDTKNDADAFMFKVQQLRNVAVTPPFFHDGSVAKLDDAVRIMGKLQLGRDLAANEVADIVSFLESLTGEVPAAFANAPVVPVTPYAR
jgi:cytochrome c peroxidase